MTNLIGYIIIIAIIWFILGGLLKSQGIKYEWGKFKPFSIKWLVSVLVIALAYVWGIVEEGFVSLGGLF